MVCADMTALFLLLFSLKLSQSFERDSSPIHWYAPFYSGGGYCSEAFSFVSVLSQGNRPLYISQHGDSLNHKFLQNMRTSEREFLDSKFLARSIPNEISICHSEPGAWHAPFPHYHTQQCPPSNSGYKIGRTMFETDRLPQGWVQRLNFMDEIWVPTDFARKVFLHEGVAVEKLHIVPEPVDTQFYSPSELSSDSEKKIALRNRISQLLRDQTEGRQQQITDSTFIYLFVGKWEYRKGVQLLLQAFLNEFNQSAAEQEEDVALIIVTSAYHSTDDFFHAILQELFTEQLLSPSILLSSSLPASLTLKDLQPSHQLTRLLQRVILLTDLPQDEMPLLYQLSNILVIPSRGEGWGRPHVEAMSCGVPIIATNWSGVTAYLTEANGFPLAIDGLIEAK
jgi:glycosyltransferase involved in cell wall biosynthesis